MGYEIIALDLDGTLLNSDGKIPPRTKSVLIEAQKLGKKVILASGRHNIGIKDIAKELELDKYGGYIMAFNGGKIIDAQTNEVISTVIFPHKYIKPVYECINESNITIITYEDNDIIMNDKVNDYTYIEADILKTNYKVVENFTDYVTFDINKLLLAGEPAEVDKYKEILIKKYKGDFDVFKSSPFFLEVMPLGVNKGASISTMLGKLGYTREQLIACGDSYNDMTMIGYAGLGVCMSDGEKEVKKIANIIADSNGNGIAKVVEEYLLCRRS